MNALLSGLLVFLCMAIGAIALLLTANYMLDERLLAALATFTMGLVGGSVALNLLLDVRNATQQRRRR